MDGVPARYSFKPRIHLLIGNRPKAEFFVDRASEHIDLFGERLGLLGPRSQP